MIVEEEEFDRRSAYTKRMLRLLSMNSRMPVSEMAESLGLSRKNVRIRLAKLEKEFKINYSLEIDVNMIGLNEPHLILVRFKREPNYAQIGNLLSESPVTQLAVVMKGHYSLLVYANAFSRPEYYAWDSKMRNKLVIPHGTQWEESEISYQRLGFLPIRSETIERSNLKQKDKTILKMLNENSRMPLKEIAKITGINYKSVAYHFKRLVSRGYIRRFTISIGMRDGMVLTTVFGRFIPPEDAEGVARVTRATFTADDPEPLISKYLVTAALMGSYGFFVMGAFKNQHRAYLDLVLKYRNVYKRFGYTESTHANIKKILVGRLPVRNVDNKLIYKDTL